MQRLRVITTVTSVSILCGAVAACAESIEVRIPADAPVGLPTVIAVPHEFRKAPPGGLDAAGGVPPGTPAQFVPDLDAEGRPLRRGTVWLPLNIAPAQRGKTLDIFLAPAARRPPPPVQLRILADQATEFVDGKRTVLRYNHGPKDLDGKADPNAVLGFIHPLYNLDGEILTQNAPKDHLHHRGLFWAWPRLKRGEKLLGNWWERKDVRYHLGRIVRRTEGPILATMTAEGFWDYQTKEMVQPERVVREVVTVRLFSDALTAAGNYQILDVDLGFYGLVDGLAMAGTETLKKGYGGLTWRWPRPEAVRIIADGKELKKDGLLYHALWADASGDFPKATRGGRSGVAILTSPSHPGSPPPWLFRFYGVLNVSYPGLEFIPLHRDKPLHLSYRLILHRGDAKQARIGELYTLYATDWAAKP
jgi:hypothetical protein